jgi:hypothetical protein
VQQDPQVGQVGQDLLVQLQTPALQVTLDTQDTLVTLGIRVVQDGQDGQVVPAPPDIPVILVLLDLLGLYFQVMSRSLIPWRTLCLTRILFII